MSIADIVIIAIVILFVIVGFKRGFVKSFVGLISIALSIVIASIAAGPIANLLYDRVLQGVITDAIGMKVTTSPVGYFAAVPSPASSLYRLPRTLTAADLAKLTDIESLLEDLDPAYVKSLDPDETQRFVNFLCSKACSGKTLSSCVSAYNKKYSTDVNIQPLLNEYGVASSTKVPALVSLSGMKIDVDDAIVKVQKDNEVKAAAASAAAASKAASSRATSSKTSSATSRTESASSRVSSPVTSSKTSSATSRVSSQTSSRASSRVTSSASSAAAVSEVSSVTPSQSSEALPQTPGNSIADAASDAIRNLAVKLVSCIVFVVLFLLIRLILRLIAKLLTSVIEKIPVVRGINRLLGGVVGIINGALVSLVAVIAFTCVSPLITDERYVAAVDNSYICNTVKDALYSDTGSAGKSPQQADGTGESSEFSEDEFDFSEDDFDFSE